MLTLSVAQPFASLLVLGARRYEIRPWHTHYRGRLALHAARRDRPAVLSPVEASVLAQAGLALARLPRGAVLGTVSLLDCVRLEDWSEGAESTGPAGSWVWLFDAPVAWQVPWPARGRLGLFELTLPEEKEEGSDG